MTFCPHWDACFNAGCDLLCADCDRTEATYKLTDAKTIEKAWNEYVDYCYRAMEASNQ